MGAAIARRQFLKNAAAVAGGVAGSRILGPAVGSTQGKELIAYYWYVPVFKEIFPQFEKETGIKIVSLGSYGGNPIWWTKMLAGEVWDFFVPSMDWLQRAARADLLEPLDLRQIPNWKNLSDQGKKVTETELSWGSKIYGVPFSMVINPLVWNTKRIPEKPDSWGSLWDPRYKGKISMKDEARLAVMVAALHTGQNPNSPSNWDQIKAVLLEQKKLVRKYWSTHEEMAEMMATEAAWLSQYTDGRVRKLQKEGVPVDFVVPKEGAPATIDALAIPKKAKNKEAAHRFIDFILRGDVMAKQMQIIGYATFNTASYAAVSPELRSKLAIAKEWKFAWRAHLAPELLNKMDSLWLEVKLG